MMREDNEDSIFKEGTVVERNIDGVWFEAVVTEVSESTLFTFYSLRYTDDGNSETDVDEQDIRLKIPVQITEPLTCSPRDEDDDDVALITAMQELFNIDPIPSNRAFFSVDDMQLPHCHRPEIHSSNLKYAVVRQRRWSFDSSPVPKFRSPTPPIAFPEAIVQRMRESRFSREDPNFFFPLAGRCAALSCCKLTIYRCQRCGQSFACSVSCQKKAWLAGHQDDCKFTPFHPLYTPPTLLLPSSTAVSMQNDWMMDDPLTVAGENNIPSFTSKATASTNLGSVDDINFYGINKISGDHTTECVYNNNIKRELVSSARATSPPIASVIASPSNTSCTIYNPLVNSAPLKKVPEEAAECDSEEFGRKVNQFCEVFSRSPSDVSRVLRFFANNEDAAVECLVRGECKTEDEVTEEVNRLSRIQKSGYLREVGGAAVAPPPAYNYSAAMTGIDDDEYNTSLCGSPKVDTDIQPIKSHVGVSDGGAEDWSHLYTPSGFGEDDDGPPPLIDVDNLPLFPSPTSSSNRGQSDDMEIIDSARGGEWWNCVEENKPWSDMDLNDQDMVTEQGRSGVGSCDNSVDEQDSRSNYFAPVGSKNLLYFIQNPESMSLSRPLTSNVRKLDGYESAVIFDGPVYLGKRMARLTVSCLLKAANKCLSVEKINVEIEPRDSIEAILLKGYKAKSSLESHSSAVVCDSRQIDVDAPLPDLRVVLTEPSSSETNLVSDDISYHVHEMNFTLAETIDLMVLHREQEQEHDNNIFDEFASREMLDASFWRVGEVCSGMCKKRSTPNDDACIVNGSDNVYEPHALGVTLVKAMLLHMHTGLLNPLSSTSNSFFHGKSSSNAYEVMPETLEEVGGVPHCTPSYMQYVLLGYQVRYRQLGDGQLRIIQSDCSERVTVRQVALHPLVGGDDSTKSDCDSKDTVGVNEELVQELMDILVVDRETAVNALNANNGDLNQATEWLLTSLNYT